jgi:spermidine/putrescine-binding protein
MPSKKEKKFDSVKYNNEYKKNNYKRINIICKPEKAEQIEDYCQYLGMNKSQFLIAAAEYIIDNNIDLNGLK